LVLMLAAAGGVAAYRFSGSTASAGSQPATERPAGKIKVGVYLGSASARRSTDGYNGQVRIMRELKGSALDVSPVIESGSETEADLGRKLDLHFYGKRALNVADATALGALNVIVINDPIVLPADALDAIEAAVTEGTGLFIRQGRGIESPGPTPQLCRLLGLKDARYAWNPEPVACEIVGISPLLGKLARERGRDVMLRPNGVYGEFVGGTVPLLKVKDAGQVQWMSKLAIGEPAPTFYPLYTTQLGKGRIVVCSFAGYTDTPPDLQTATADKFTVHAMQWLANRPLE
jgi:hypothetical protein